LTENGAVRIIGNPRYPKTMETLGRGRATRRKAARIMVTSFGLTT
jgi:hypothetical protein